MLRFLITLLLISVCSAWIPLRRTMKLQRSVSELYSHLPEPGFNPCWQDIYDGDCTEDSVFSATYIASDWIKELPCGSGLEDCDFPKDALLPEMRPESASHTEIDVMDFLNIKRPGESNFAP